jgi:hypothetical protein
VSCVNECLGVDRGRCVLGWGVNVKEEVGLETERWGMKRSMYDSWHV